MAVTTKKQRPSVWVLKIKLICTYKQHPGKKSRRAKLRKEINNTWIASLFSNLCSFSELQSGELIHYDSALLRLHWELNGITERIQIE